MSEPNVNNERSRAEKLANVRTALGEGFLSNHVVYQAVDYLFEEVDRLVKEVEELRAKLGYS